MPNNPFNNPIGLDISDLKLRFFQFDKRGAKKIKIRSFGEIAVPPGNITEGEIKNESQVKALIRQLLDKPLYGKIKEKYINASLPEKKTFIKLISIPRVPEEEMRGTVSWGIEQNIPVTMDQVYFDWHILPDQNPKAKESPQEVIVGVAPKSIIDSYIQLLESVGFTVVGLENESVAIARCLIDQLSDVRDPLLILDLGKSRTNIMIYAKNTIQSTSTIEINGAEMTQSIAERMQLSHDDAEKAKIICGLDKKKGRGAIRAILEPAMNQLSEKIKENLDYYCQYVSPGEKINTIILTGSVSQMVGLTDFLREKLSCTIIIGDPWSNIKQMTKDNRKIATHSRFYSYTTAIGLALKDFSTL